MFNSGLRERPFYLKEGGMCFSSKYSDPQFDEKKYYGQADKKNMLKKNSDSDKIKHTTNPLPLKLNCCYLTKNKY